MKMRALSSQLTFLYVFRKEFRSFFCYHIKDNKMIKNDNKKNSKKLVCYICEFCDFNTSNKNDYMRHISTDKHIKITMNNDFQSEKLQKLIKTHDCICGKSYRYASGLSVHKKKCSFIKNELINSTTLEDEEKKNSTDEIATLKEIVFEVLNQNKELQKTIQEMIPKMGSNNNSNNNIIVNNLTLLNDNCKDAISINEFIDSIKIETKDLMYTSDKGLTNGITNIFLENYNKLPIQMRPLWCVDKKRKKLYIKDDKWEEDKGNQKTKDAIKSLTVKQAKNTGKYTKENPDWMDHDKKKDRFINMVKQTTLELDDDKQINIINNLIDNVHLSDDTRNELQKYKN
jgi:hypothetical protein